MPTLSARLDRAMETLAKRKRWSLIAHGSMLLFTAICVATVWWSVGVRLPLLTSDSAEMRRVNRLQNMVEQARLQESVNIERTILQRTTEHEKELFGDRKAVVNWLRSQIERAQQHGISLRYRLGGVRPALMTHKAMAIALNMRVVRVAKEGGYRQLLEFVEAMQRDALSMNVEQISMHGGGNGVSTMDLQITIWLL
ncbi:MAG: hypothetical protein Q9M13_08420 [Mariprofundales bacterium]|nr:hypothetical protein [Mariprofundales bacterium]